MAKNKITAITPRESLIKRITVYFGREMGDEEYPYSTQKSVMVREIIDNAIDALTKFKNSKGTIRVTFFKDGSVEVYDSGPGIPVELTKTVEDRPASSLYVAMGLLNSGSNYTGVTDSMGTNGVGGAGCQMLSEYMKIEVYTDKKKYRLDFRDGQPGLFDENDKFKPLGKDLTKLDISKDDRPTDEKKIFPTGTRIRFKINSNIIKSKYPYDTNDLKERMKGISFIKDNIVFEVRDYLGGNGELEIYNFGGGIQHIVDVQSTNFITPIYNINSQSSFEDKYVDINDATKIITVNKEIKVEAAFAYKSDFTYELDSYVNMIKTRLGGTHVIAFEEAFTKVMNNKMQSMRGYLSKNEKELPIFADYSEGLSLVVSIYLPEPDFTAQTKEELFHISAKKELVKLFTGALENWVNDRKNQEAVKAIADKVIETYRIRVKRKEEKAIKREKMALEKTTKMPEKLLDCEITHSEFSELYICEGESAKTGLKSARNSQYQALLPIRGKIINPMKATTKKLLENQEIQSIAKCLDAGIGKDYKHENARYQKVFIAVDADPDGAHIANLLISVIWTLFPEVLTSGNLYKVLTPLYIIKTKDKEIYCLNKSERDKALSELPKNTKYEIIRAKGLGETGDDALEETGMCPQTRRIQRILIDDVHEAKQMLEIVMGDDAEQRKEWLIENPYVEED